MAMEDFRVDVIVGKGPGATAIPLELPPVHPGRRHHPGRTAAAPAARPLRLHRRTWSSTTPPSWSGSSTARPSLLDVEIDADGAAEIAGRSRGTPRIANRLLRRVRDYAQVKADGVITREIAARGPRRSTRSTPAASTGSTGRCSRPCSSCSAAARSACPRSPSPWGRSARPSRRSPSPSSYGRDCWPGPPAAGSPPPRPGPTSASSRRSTATGRKRTTGPVRGVTARRYSPGQEPRCHAGRCSIGADSLRLRRCRPCRVGIPTPVHQAAHQRGRAKEIPSRESRDSPPVHRAHRGHVPDDPVRQEEAAGRPRRCATTCSPAPASGRSGACTPPSRRSTTTRSSSRSRPASHALFAKNAIGAVLDDEEYNRIVHGIEHDLNADGTVVPDDASSLTETDEPAADDADASDDKPSTSARRTRPTTPADEDAEAKDAEGRRSRAEARPTARPTRSSHGPGRARPPAPASPGPCGLCAGQVPTPLRGRPRADPARGGRTGRNEKVAAPKKGRRPASAQGKPGRALALILIAMVALTGGMFALRAHHAASGHRPRRRHEHHARGEERAGQAERDQQDQHEHRGRHHRAAVSTVWASPRPRSRPRATRNIIVNIPKGTNSKQAREQVGTTAQLYFRPVLTRRAAGAPAPPEPDARAPREQRRATASRQGRRTRRRTADRSVRRPRRPPPPRRAARSPTRLKADPTPTAARPPASRQAPPSAAPRPRAAAPTRRPPTLQAKFAALDCTDKEQPRRRPARAPSPPTPIVACGQNSDGQWQKYVLGPAEVDGTRRRRRQGASSTRRRGRAGSSPMDFTSEGAKKFADDHRPAGAAAAAAEPVRHRPRRRGRLRTLRAHRR